MIQKIKMKTPLVEIDGDEMTRVIWKQIKDILLLPYVDLKTEYFDLGLKKRNDTDDQITMEAANAIKRLGVAVKCATITPNAQRVKEYNLKKMWSSPNATIRASLDGTVFRKPIIVKNIRPFVNTWTKPITIARHAYGDVYKGVEMIIRTKGKAGLIFNGEDGQVFNEIIHDFKNPGIIQGIYNLDGSIENFARTCFGYALEERADLWFSAKDTISKKYDHTFKDIFQRVYENEFSSKFTKAGIRYNYTLIDDAIARAMRSSGGFVWACKNYDGDVISDMVASAFGSLAMMTSVLVSPEGHFEYEAAHGTVTRHYYQYLEGRETSTNPVATLFAWSGALRKKSEIDGLNELGGFADRLENATLDSIEAGIMTKDLASLAQGEAKIANTSEFLSEINARLEKSL